MNNIHNLVQSIKTNGTLLSHQLTDPSLGVKHYRCSIFIPKKKLLIKGEFENPKSEERRALLVFFEPLTGKVKGGSVIFF